MPVVAAGTTAPLPVVLSARLASPFRLWPPSKTPSFYPAVKKYACPLSGGLLVTSCRRPAGQFAAELPPCWSELVGATSAGPRLVTGGWAASARDIFHRDRPRRGGWDGESGGCASWPPKRRRCRTSGIKPGASDHHALLVRRHRHGAP